MPFDAIVTNPGRLRILTALAVDQQQDFVELRRRTELTDGNLSSHAKRLSTAGMIKIDKTFRSGKPVTQFRLTPEGRGALESHVRRLMSALTTRRLDTADRQPETPVRQLSDRSATPDAPVSIGTDVDDWVD